MIIIFGSYIFSLAACKSVCTVDVSVSMSCLFQDSEYVVAVRNYITEDRSLLSFHKGDIIRLQHRDGLEAGETFKHTHNWHLSVSYVQCVLVSYHFMLCLYTFPCAYVCVFRQILRLHSEEESHASGRAKERDFRVWWVWQC